MACHFVTEKRWQSFRCDWVTLHPIQADHAALREINQAQIIKEYLEYGDGTERSPSDLLPLRRAPMISFWQYNTRCCGAWCRGGTGRAEDPAVIGRGALLRSLAICVLLGNVVTEKGRNAALDGWITGSVYCVHSGGQDHGNSQKHERCGQILCIV